MYKRQLYQFLVAVRQGEQQGNLTNAAGEVTSHIQGFLSRTVRLLENDIKPVYVFDGKPPELKQATLANRKEKKEEADAELATATEDMDALTFSTAVMLKNLFDVESSRAGTKRPIFEISLETMLAQLDVPMPLFIDFCIMCGCDYCGTIRGVGPSTAFKLLKTHGSIEKAVASMDASTVSYTHLTLPTKA